MDNKEEKDIAYCYKCGRPIDPEGDDCCGKHQFVHNGELIVSGYN